MVGGLGVEGEELSHPLLRFSIFPFPQLSRRDRNGEDGRKFPPPRVGFGEGGGNTARTPGKMVEGGCGGGGFYEEGREKEKREDYGKEWEREGNGRLFGGCVGNEEKLGFDLTSTFRLRERSPPGELSLFSWFWRI